MAQAATSPARQGTRWGRIVAFVLLCLGSAIFSIPFVWTVSTALKTKEQVFAVPPVDPNPVQWENFRRAWTELLFPIFVFNTVLITLIPVVGRSSASLVAYGFARFRFKGRTFLFTCSSPR